MHRQSVLEPADNVPKSETELEERRVGVQILADSEKLKTTYDTLKQHVVAWNKVVKSAHKDIQELDRTIAESVSYYKSFVNTFVTTFATCKYKKVNMTHCWFKISFYSYLQSEPLKTSWNLNVQWRICAWRNSKRLDSRMQN